MDIFKSGDKIKCISNESLMPFEKLDFNKVYTVEHFKDGIVYLVENGYMYRHWRFKPVVTYKNTPKEVI